KRMRVDVLGATVDGATPAVKNALDRDRDVPAIAVMNPDARVATTGNELDTTDHGPIVPGRTHGALVPLSTTAAADANAGTVRPLAPDAVTVQPIPQPILPVPNADRTVAGLRAAFRRCYQNGLANEPGMQGQLVVTTRIELNGSVESAR